MKNFSKPLAQVDFGIKNNRPLVSVITIVFNGEDYLEQTITSVLEQTYQDIEYIVIDGASTDGSLVIIDRYKSKFAYFVSEPDQGIGDAMNKGLQRAKGDYIIFLHADDFFVAPNVLAEVFRKLRGYPEIILCDILFGRDFQKRTSRGLNYWMNFKTGIQHQGAICSRRVFDEIGGFDEQFKIAVDYDFFLRAYRPGIKAKKIPLVLSVMRDCGISSRTAWVDLKLRFEEERRIHIKNLTIPALAIIYDCYWLMYMPYRRLKSRLKKQTALE